MTTLSTSSLTSYPSLTACSLSQSAEGGSSLTLEFAGQPPSWANYWEQVVLLHQGRALFTGQITAVAFTNSGGEQRTQLTVDDYWYLVENMSAQSQLQNLGEVAHYAGWRNLTREKMSSWAELARNVAIPASGWTCSATGGPGPGVVRLNVSGAGMGLAPGVPKDRAYTQLEIFQMMQQCNPDCIFISEPTGTIRVVSIKSCPTLTLRTDRMMEAAKIYPGEAGKITGAVCALYVKFPRGGNTIVPPMDYIYTDYIGSSSGPGVRLFLQTWEVPANCFIDASVPKKMLSYMMDQARIWYNACQGTPWFGSITMPAAELASSPLGSRINISGGLAAWAGMATPCTAVDWDFFTGRATLSLGKTLADPTLNQLELDTAAMRAAEMAGTQGGGGGGGECDCKELWEIAQANFNIIQGALVDLNNSFCINWNWQDLTPIFEDEQWDKYQR